MTVDRSGIRIDSKNNIYDQNTENRGSPRSRTCCGVNTDNNYNHDNEVHQDESQIAGMESMREMKNDNTVTIAKSKYAILYITKFLEIVSIMVVIRILYQHVKITNR